MNTHSTVQKLLTAYALGELSQQDTLQVQAHLAECDSCRDQLAEIQAVLNIADSMKTQTAPQQVHNVATQEIQAASGRTKTEKSEHISWSRIMKSNITKSAAAAIIIIGVLTGIYQLTGSIDGAVPAFADVLENISNITSVVYREKTEVFGPQKLNFTSTKMVNQYGIIRSELEHGQIMIMDVANRITLWLTPSQKKAERYGKPTPNMKSGKFSYVGWLRKLHETEAEFAHEEELDGIMTNVYVWEVPFEKITVWVDPKINLPVKVEHKTFANTEQNVVMPQLSISKGDFGGDPSVSAGSSIGSGRGSGKGISQDMIRTLYNFQWNVELDESLFGLEPPEGYTLEQKYTEQSPVDENSLVHILDLWARYNDGAFPTAEQLNDPETFKPLIIEEYDGDGDPEEEFDEARKEVSRVLKGIYFVQERKVDGRWSYVGDNVMLGEQDLVVCWWFDEETDGYRAILGDLSIVDMEEDQLPTQP